MATVCALKLGVEGRRGGIGFLDLGQRLPSWSDAGRHGLDGMLHSHVKLLIEATGDSQQAMGKDLNKVGLSTRQGFKVCM